jgi:hemolysin activation/secretion protein
VGRFGEAGFTGEFILDSRDVRGAPRSGLLATATGAWYPLTDDGGSGFGSVVGSVASYWTPRWWRSMTVATRISGTHTWGKVPYFEAAFIGGGRTVRGLPQGRYEGNQAAFANLDLRFRVSQVQFVLPWDFGVLGLADLGRVWVTGESSGTWHPSFGGGLWVALMDRSLAASLNVATGAGQGVFLNAGGGFSF